MNASRGQRGWRVMAVAAAFQPDEDQRRAVMTTLI